MSIKSNSLFFGCLNAVHRYNLSTQVHQVISFLNLPLACDDNIVIMSDGSFWQVDFGQTEIKKLNSPYQGSLFSVCMKNDFIFLGTSFDKLLVCKRNEDNSIQVHQTIDLSAYPVYSVNFDAMLSCSAGKSHFTFTYSAETQQFIQQSVNTSKSRIWSVNGDYFGNDLGELFFKNQHIISLFEAPIRQILPHNNCLVCVQNNNAIFIVDPNLTAFTAQITESEFVYQNDQTNNEYIFTNSHVLKNGVKIAKLQLPVVHSKNHFCSTVCMHRGAFLSSSAQNFYVQNFNLKENSCLVQIFGQCYVCELHTPNQLIIYQINEQNTQLSLFKIFSFDLGEVKVTRISQTENDYFNIRINKHQIVNFNLHNNFRMLQQPNIPSKEINCACAFKEDLVTVSEDQYLTVYKNASQMFQMRFEASLKSVAVLNDYIVIGGCKNLLCLLKLNSFYQVEQIITSSYQKEVQNFKFTSIVTLNDLIVASDSTGFIHVYSLINNNLTLVFTFNLETVVFKLSVFKNQILYSGTQKYGLIDLEFEEIFKIVQQVQNGEINVPLVEIIKNQTSVVEYTQNQQKLHSVLEKSNEELGSGNECFQIKEEICVCFDSGKVILCDEKLNTRIEKDISHSGILCGANIRNQICVVGWDRIVRTLDMELKIVQNDIIDVYQLHKMIELNEKMVIVGNGIVFE
ncbi:Conserved_hypothetical protein [Hexamita inflata]|uniref:Uncharacterized protein n=1 Tax=Hexamita inflata TaxID=28002 RepID=A0AA86RM63_9EUKA|nr:Conserved hypothetical protein [Hexamita inflata]